MLSNATPTLLNALLPAAWRAHQQLAGLALAASSINSSGSDLCQIGPHTQTARASAVQLLARSFRTSSSTAQDRLVDAFIQDVLSSLSIPHAELGSLAASELSDAALTAWALTKTASHPAVQQAAAASQRLQALLAKLDGAMLWQQQAAGSPLGQLLWQVAVGANGSEVASLSPEQLEGRLEYQVVQALTRESSLQQARQLLQQVVGQLHQLTDMPPLQAVSQPAFWQLAQQAAAGSQALSQDLQLLGYDLTAAASSAASQLQQLQQLLGVNPAELQQQLLRSGGVDASLLQPGRMHELLAAVPGDAAAKQAVAGLQLLQVLSQALGLSAVHVCSSISPFELVARLTGRQQQQRELGEDLQQQLAAAAPQLLAAVQQLPAAALEQATVGSLLQLLNSKPELQGLAKSITAWRAEAAAAGHLPVLSSLSQAEVSGLSKPQAEGLARAMMRLEARGSLLMRKAAAKALQLSQLDAGDAAALAWKVHTGGAAAAEELVRLLLQQASSEYSSALHELGSAEAALSHMAAGFKLEEATSRRCSAAPPSALLMAGVPQHQVSELSKSLPSLGSSAQRGSSSRGVAESLVRDLALLLNLPDTGNTNTLAGQSAAVQRLQYAAHDLPKVLSGPLLELLIAHQQDGGVTDAAGARQQQQRLRAFVSALEAELPRMAASTAPESGSSGSSAWATAGSAGVPAAAAEGLLELLGPEESAELLADAAAKPRRQGSDDEDEESAGLYEMLADVHADVDMQRYLQMEFDPALELDVVHAPLGWQAPDLFTAPDAFLDGMRPLLDQYLAAQGQQPTHDLEWQVYRDAALAEHEQVEIASAASHRAAGHSPFHNSRADEAYLLQRVDAAIPKDSVLYTAAHKYLKASFKNRSWTFAQRKRMVDRLAEIAGHLAAHPPRTHRGSPFSALFQPDGPPAAPRLTRDGGATRAGAGAGDNEAYALPAGFGPGV